MIARWLAAIACAVAFVCAPVQAQREAAPAPTLVEVSVAQLPAEAQVTVALIRAGGPFPYARDGVTFGNREGRLPREKRGYYHEYTVKTPGERTRGARRIIAGKGGELYYTDDHYNHFRRIRE
ncbi:MAG TPA: ribonuclease domain-containing protein [Usitatibacter sp.]|nr:ribonuclease domain-containing protein [Usitatibacter sp.]